MSTTSRPPLVVQVKRRERNFSARSCFVENQIGICLGPIALLFLTHCIPSARVYTAKFLSLSYYNDETRHYGLGFDDAYLVVFLVALFTGLRAASSQSIFTPFARWYGLGTSRTTRFSEQAWMVLYYLICWPIGMYIYTVSPYWLDLGELWTCWPQRETAGPMKAYMLAQLAFWLHQIILINIEKRRKDHWQMFSHHIVTIALIYSSYRYGLTRVGNVILVLLDINDLVFSTAKCLKYLELQTLCDMMFGVFVVSWIMCRHVAFVMVCWSVYAHMPQYMTAGCFRGSGDKIWGPLPIPADGNNYLLEPLASSSGLVCFNSVIRLSFLGGLLFLQGLMIFWFIMIVRLVIRVLYGENAEDTRSDDEEEDQSASRMERPAERDIGAEHLKHWAEQSGTGIIRPDTHQRSRAISGSLQRERKRLLDRIGCDKKIE
ncbi:hypothetical protein FZEAL_253 [Fusarium zealandicum]|uniref:TLC domain-containing protein n=1 Tax=Fusarium zealandicum TaxID=1053134 RepID=A0A8H4UVJ1_9HYPO|nr:hypothetical protein FZEAL_253 [Fusarium zealandicum]